jgi:hypothetical protein
LRQLLLMLGLTGCWTFASHLPAFVSPRPTRPVVRSLQHVTLVADVQQNRHDVVVAVCQVPAQTPNDEAVQQVAPQVLNLHVILGMFSNFGHWPCTLNCHIRPQPCCCSGCSIGKAACQLRQTNQLDLMDSSPAGAG